MKLTYKNNFIGYVRFYYSVVGARFMVFLVLSIIISALDGMGLAMFIPLLESVADPSKQVTGGASLGQLRHLTDFIQWLGFELNIRTVLGSLCVLFVMKGSLRYYQMRYYAKMRQLFIRRVRYNLIDNLQNLSYSAFLKMDAGKIQNTLTVDVQRLFQTMLFYFNSAQAFVMLGTYMALAFLANYQFALLVGIGAGFSNLLYRKIYKATKKASIEISKKGSDFNSFLTQSTTYFKYLKSTNMFNKYAKKLKVVVDEAEALNRKIGNLNAITTAVKEPMIIVVVTVVILVQISWMGANLSSIVLSLLLFYRALSFLVVVQNHWQGFIENIGGMNAVATMTEEMAGMKEVQGEVEFKGIHRGVSLRNVEFYYDTKKVLNGINIDIPKRQTIALVGESGSGKTTLANMIAGLIMPNTGMIYVDDKPFSEMNLDTFRSRIGYISQESVIFNDTIYNNITFWAEPTPENVKRFNQIVEMASLQDFVNTQPQKEQTRLGDNGILISGGQKQRISIARELYKSTEILIFDEATSALDSETEKIIQENIEKLYGSYTMILIAHRLSTIKRADTIYLLEQGKVSASGSFEEMIHKSSKFQKMVSLQGF